MPALTRGPLPARVYWVRRLLVLGVAALLVVGIARLLGGGSDGSSSADEAAQVAADVTVSDAPSTSGSTWSAPPTIGAGPSDRASKGHEPVRAQPDGPCADEDVAVTPEVDDAVAGRDVTVHLQLQTLTAQACTWEVSPDSLTVTITSGKDDIWSSRDCPRAIPTREVVVRKDVVTDLAFTWEEARRSGDSCYRGAEWAMPGWYHVTAAALAGEPSDVQFQLTTPTPETITKSADPTQGPSGRPITPSKSASKSASKSPSKSPSGSGSGSGSRSPSASGAGQAD